MHLCKNVWRMESSTRQGWPDCVLMHLERHHPTGELRHAHVLLRLVVDAIDQSREARMTRARQAENAPRVPGKDQS